MASFEDFLNLTKETAEKVGRKTGELWDVTKVKMELSSVEKELSSTLEGLGRVVYESRKSDEDATDAILACIDHVDELMRQADELRARIDAFKNVKRCGACGANNPEEADFCQKCGTKLG